MERIKCRKVFINDVYKKIKKLNHTTLNNVLITSSVEFCLEHNEEFIDWTNTRYIPYILYRND